MIIGARGHPRESFVNDNQISCQEFDAQLSVLQCTICYDIMNDPRQCVNGHMYCKNCILESMLIRSQCPSCLEPMSSSSLSMCLLARNLINGLTIRCCKYFSTSNNNEEYEWNDETDECPWKGKLSELEAHTQECDYQLTKCQNEGCVRTMLRKDLKAHRTHCIFRIESCKYCSNTFYHHQLSTHISACPWRAVPCPNDGCEEKIRLVDICEHKSVCEWEEVECRLYAQEICSSACPGRIRRRDVNSHMLSASTVIALMNATITMKSELNLLKRKFETELEEKNEMKFEMNMLSMRQTVSVDTNINIEATQTFMRWIHMIEQANDRMSASALHDQLTVQSSCQGRWCTRHIIYEMTVPSSASNIGHFSAMSSPISFEEPLLGSLGDHQPIVTAEVEVSQDSRQLGVYTNILHYTGRTRVIATMFRFGQGEPLRRRYKRRWSSTDVAYGWPDFIGLDELERGGYSQEKYDNRIHLIVTVCLKVTTNSCKIEEMS